MNELYHFGIPGMKWGVRRYQNYDGSLTAAGRTHYGVGERIKNYRTNLKRKRALAKARKTRAEKKKRAEGDKSVIWKEYSNDDLKKFNERQQLEQNATRLQIDKMNRGKQYADLIIGYAKTGVEAYGVYKNLMSIAEEIDNGGHPKKTYSQKYAENLLKDIEDKKITDFTDQYNTATRLEKLNQIAKGSGGKGK